MNIYKGYTLEDLMYDLDVRKRWKVEIMKDIETLKKFNTIEEVLEDTDRYFEYLINDVEEGVIYEIEDNTIKNVNDIKKYLLESFEFHTKEEEKVNKEYLLRVS